MRRPRIAHPNPINSSCNKQELLVGQALVGVEPSGRISLPALWRHKFIDSAFVLPRSLEGEDPYVMMFTGAGLVSRMQELRTASHREILLRSVSKVNIDKQSRAVVPEAVELLGGASYMAVVGGGDHLRLMSEGSAAYLTRYDADALSEII